MTSCPLLLQFPDVKRHVFQQVADNREPAATLAPALQEAVLAHLQARLQGSVAAAGRGVPQQSLCEMAAPATSISQVCSTVGLQACT